MQREKDLERVEETWKEMGKKIQVLRSVVLVRTYPLPEKTSGGIILSEKMRSFYGELPHVQLISGTVLSSGPKAVSEVGDKVCFQRLFFAKLEVLADKTIVGWIADERNLIGWQEGDVAYSPMSANAKRAPKAPDNLGKKGMSFG